MEDRQKFIFEGKTIYEWSQNLAEVDIYIFAPPVKCFFILGINKGIY